MVEVKIGERGYNRQRALAVIKSHRTKGVRVLPRDERVRAAIKHPKGMGFRSTGSVEWPNDRFTRRRIADGTVKLVTEEKKATSQAVEDRARPSGRRLPQASESSTS